MSWLLFCDMSKALSSDRGPLKNTQKSSHFLENKDPGETPFPPCMLSLLQLVRVL